MMNFKAPKFRRRMMLASAALAGAVGLAGVAQAGPWGHHRGGPGGGGGLMRGLMHMIDELDLSEQQELELVRIRRSARSERKAMHEAMQADVDALIEMLGDGEVDKDAVHARIDAMMARASGRAHAMADRALAFHTTLSPEQKQKLAKGLADKRDRMKARFERRRGAEPTE